VTARPLVAHAHDRSAPGCEPLGHLGDLRGALVVEVRRRARRAGGLLGAVSTVRASASRAACPTERRETSRSSAMSASADVGERRS
jgi:hypothetical protein